MLRREQWIIQWKEPFKAAIEFVFWFSIKWLGRRDRIIVDEFRIWANDDAPRNLQSNKVTYWRHFVVLATKYGQLTWLWLGIAAHGSLSRTKSFNWWRKCENFAEKFHFHISTRKRAANCLEIKWAELIKSLRRRSRLSGAIYSFKWETKHIQMKAAKIPQVHERRTRERFISESALLAHFLLLIEALN